MTTLPESLRAGLAAGTITRTTMALPPQLVAGTGYAHAARFVALCWTSYGDDLVVDDGQIRFTGQRQAYGAWRDHPYVAWQTPIGVACGSSDSLTTHRWLIDQAEGVVYVGTDRAVRQVVRDQWPPAPTALPGATFDDGVEVPAAVASQLRLSPSPTQAQILEAMEAEARLVRQLVAWLDERWAALVVTQAAPVPVNQSDLVGGYDLGTEAAGDAARRRN